MHSRGCHFSPFVGDTTCAGAERAQQRSNSRGGTTFTFAIDGEASAGSQRTSATGCAVCVQSNIEAGDPHRHEVARTRRHKDAVSRAIHHHASLGTSAGRLRQQITCGDGDGDCDGGAGCTGGIVVQARGAAGEASAAPKWQYRAHAEPREPRSDGQGTA